jgi:hypothetical protein
MAPPTRSRAIYTTTSAEPSEVLRFRGHSGTLAQATALSPDRRRLASNAVNQAPRVAAPTFQLLQWIAERSPSYPETIEAWKTSCPRLSVWEDALADDLVCVRRGHVLLTARGNELLMTVPG